MPLTHARCAESARCTACGNMPRPKSAPASNTRGRNAPGSRRTHQIGEREQRDREEREQDEPDEQLLRRREARERPRRIEGGDDARDADEVIRVGRHRQVARGPKVDHRIDQHAAPHRGGAGHGHVREVGREADTRADQRALHDRARQCPQRGRPSQHERQAEIDAKEHGEPGEHAADQRPPPGAIVDVDAETRVQQRDQRAQRERGAARPRDRDELQRRHDEHDVEHDCCNRDRSAPPPHEQPGPHGHADELRQSGEAFDEQMCTEQLVERGERPEAARAVEVQEVLVGHRPVQHAVGEDEHEALLHRGTGGVQERAQRERVRDRGDRNDDPPRRGRRSRDP